MYFRSFFGANEIRDLLTFNNFVCKVPNIESERFVSFVLLIVFFYFFFRDSICEKLLEYNVHKEKKDSTRFARGTSETFQALDNLVAKGVKVDLGIPKG